MSTFAFRKTKMVVLYSLASGLVIDPVTEQKLKKGLVISSSSLLSSNSLTLIRFSILGSRLNPFNH